MLERFSVNCIKDSFTFSETIQQLKLDSDNVCLCSFDVTGLFTNVPLTDTIKICSSTLYEDSTTLTTPPIPQKVFIEQMEYATSSVEFTFNNKMYRQIDGVAMGSPLGPAFANIFVGFYEEKLFSQIAKSQVYFKYVDDTFVFFHHEVEVGEFLIMLNNLHPSLKFTFEKEMDKQFPFLDFCVEKRNYWFERNFCKKPTFTGQYLRRESFCQLAEN